MKRAKSADKVQARKSRGLEKAKEEQDMSMTQAQEGKMKGQVKTKRMSGLCERRFSFPNKCCTPEAWKGERAEDRGFKVEG